MRGPAPLDSSRARNSPTPVADGSGRDRQTMVVGRGPAALATAGFLDQAGLNPVLAEGADTPPEPAVVTLCRPGLELLERLGLRRPIQAIGTPLRDLRCIEPPRFWSRETTGGLSVIAVRRDRLEAVMTRHLNDRIRTANRQVVRLRPTDVGVRTTFEDGITESFDAVATTRRTLLPDCGPAGDSTSVHWWSFEWPSTVSAPDVPAEAWGGNCAAFATPVGEAVSTIIVATDRAKPSSPVSIASLCDQFGHLWGSLGNAISALDQSALRYRQTSHAVPGTLRVENVALVGPAAHLSIPGGCLGPTLAVEDGWVVADALAYGPASVEAALAEYAARRRRRLSAISSGITDAALLERVSSELSGLPRHLCAHRTLAFDHLFDSTVPFTGEIPEQL